MQKLTYLEIDNTKIPMIFEKSELLPIVSLKIIIKTSSALQEHKPSLGSITAKIFNEGTKKMGANDFAKRLEDRAINFGVYSDLETFSFSVSSLKENFPYGVKMLCKLLKNPNLTEASLEKVKTLTRGKILNKKSDFDYIASSELKKILYKNTPLEHPILGDEESLEQTSLQDVKEFIKFLNLQNAYVVVGGDLEEEEAQNVALDVLSHLKTGEKIQTKSYKTSNKKQIKTIIKPSEQAYIYFGSPFFMRLGDEQIYKAKVLSFILGASGFGSRLMEEIRVNRGLAYSVYAKISVGSLKSEFSGYLQTKNQNKDQAVSVVKELVGEFVKKGVSQKELDDTKKFYLGSEPLLGEVLAQRLSQGFSEVYSGFSLGHHKRELELIKNLKLQELNDFIKSHEEINELSFAIVTNEK